MPKTPLEVPCTCGAAKNEPCKTFSFDEYHRYRYQRAVTYGRKPSPVTNVPGPRPKITEPIGKADLDGFILAVNCNDKNCRASRGKECNTSRGKRWHASRVRKGTAAMERYRNQ